MAVRRRRSWGTVRRRGGGEIQASYIGPDGNRYYAPVRYSAKVDAEGWLSAERKLIELGEWKPPAERAAQRAADLIVFRAYATRWLAERDLSPKTRWNYSTILDSRILPAFGDETVRDITPALVRTWWAGLGKATPTRSAHAYQLLKTILNTAVADHLIAENPCQVAGAGKPPKRREVELLTPAELVDVTAKMPVEYRAAVPVAAWCGLRFGELIELRRKDIATAGEQTVLRIRRSATRVDGKLIVGPPKSDAGIRDVHVPPHVADILAEHMKTHTGRGPESFVFTTTRGLRLSQTAFTKSFKAALPKGKSHMRVHDLRHVGAVLAAQAGATTKELMQRLGHTTPEMAMRYQHASAARDAAIADALSKLANPE